MRVLLLFACLVPQCRLPSALYCLPCLPPCSEHDDGHRPCAWPQGVPDPFGDRRFADLAPELQACGWAVFARHDFHHACLPSCHSAATLHLLHLNASAQRPCLSPAYACHLPVYINMPRISPPCTAGHAGPAPGAPAAHSRPSHALGVGQVRRSLRCRLAGLGIKPPCSRTAPALLALHVASPSPGGSCVPRILPSSCSLSCSRRCPACFPLSLHLAFSPPHLECCTLHLSRCAPSCSAIVFVVTHAALPCNIETRALKSSDSLLLGLLVSGFCGLLRRCCYRLGTRSSFLSRSLLYTPCAAKLLALLLLLLKCCARLCWAACRGSACTAPPPEPHLRRRPIGRAATCG